MLYLLLADAVLLLHLAFVPFANGAHGRGQSTNCPGNF
jgi:hypothetical protein